MNTKSTFVTLVAEDDEDDHILLSQAFARYQPGCQLCHFSPLRLLYPSAHKKSPPDWGDP